MIFRVALALIALGLSACSSITRVPVPEAAALAATSGVPGPIRIWGDAAPSNTVALVQERSAQLLAAGVPPSAAINLLAISGGASDGAFGAGLLAGWTAAGTRPKFDVVTGVSTGAIIAPFAFLGSAYDDQLRSAFTEHRQADIYQTRNIFSAVANASLADTTPLANMIAQHVTPEMVAAIAAEHRRGRRLFIGTTHLDAQRPVIWSIGEIAQRGDLAAIDLIRKIILASASIPGVFPPVLINVQYEGKSYDEMHVDGGITNQVFIFPAQANVRTFDKRFATARSRRLFIIRNGRLNPEWEAVEPGLLKIATRSVYSLLKYQGMGDLNRLYAQARDNRFDFNLASIPASFLGVEKDPFDIDYMRQLYDVGLQLGRAGYPWQKAPPSFTRTPPAATAATAAPVRAGL